MIKVRFVEILCKPKKIVKLDRISTQNFQNSISVLASNKSVHRGNLRPEK